MRLHLAQEETTCQLDVPAATAIVTDIHDSAAERSSLLELITFPRGKKTSQAGGGGGDSPISKLHQGMGGGAKYQARMNARARGWVGTTNRVDGRTW